MSGADYSKPPRSLASDVIKEAAREQMRFINANREKLVTAWLAETGLRPSESVIVEQQMGDGTLRVWLERREPNPADNCGVCSHTMGRHNSLGCVDCDCERVV